VLLGGETGVCKSKANSKAASSMKVECARSAHCFSVDCGLDFDVFSHVRRREKS
jgi:hypothetical protein